MTCHVCRGTPDLYFTPLGPGPSSRQIHLAIFCSTARMGAGNRDSDRQTNIQTMGRKKTCHMDVAWRKRFRFICRDVARWVQSRSTSESRLDTFKDIWRATCHQHARARVTGAGAALHGFRQNCTRSPITLMETRRTNIGIRASIDSGPLPPHTKRGC